MFLPGFRFGLWWASDPAFATCLVGKAPTLSEAVELAATAGAATGSSSSQQPQQSAKGGGWMKRAVDIMVPMVNTKFDSAVEQIYKILAKNVTAY